MTSGRRALRRLTYGFAAAILTVAVTTSGVHADPASDAVAQLDELSLFIYTGSAYEWDRGCVTWSVT